MNDPIARDLADMAGKASDLLTAMSSEKRLMIMCHLMGGELSVGDLAQRLGMSQSALSQQLAKLRVQKLVETRRDAQHIYYRLVSDDAIALLRTLHGLFRAPHR